MTQRQYENRLKRTQGRCEVPECPNPGNMFDFDLEDVFCGILCRGCFNGVRFLRGQSSIIRPNQAEAIQEGCVAYLDECAYYV